MKQIPLTQGKFAIVDDEDFDWLSQWKWQAKKQEHIFYAFRNAWREGKHTTVRMHREILRLSGDVIGEHIDGDGLNNQRSNLRICTDKENVRNCKLRKDNKSGYKGVGLKKSINKWVARIRINGKDKHLGYFDSVIKAAQAYDIAALKYFGEFARLNFPRSA